MGNNDLQHLAAIVHDSGNATLDENPEGSVTGWDKGAERTSNYSAEEKLRERTEQLNEAERLAGLGSWEWDVRENRVTWSEGLFRLFGVQPQQFGATFEAYMDYVYPDDRQMVHRDVEKALQEKGSFIHQCRFVKPDGTVRYNQARGETVLDQQGNVVRMHGTAQDITERKQVEKLLQEKEAKLAEAQEIAHIGSWEFDVETGEAIWSDELYRIFGMEPQSRPGGFELYMEFVHPDDMPQVGNQFERTTSEGGSFEYDHRAICADGSLKYLSARGKVLIDEVGKPTRIVGTAQDITERRMAEEELRNSELRYRTLVEDAADAIFTTDNTGRILDANSKASDMLGYTRQEFLQLSDRDLLSEEHHDQMGSEWVNILNVGKTMVAQRRMCRKDGTFLYAETSAKMLDDGRFQAIVRDVTERKLAEDALRDSEKKFRAIFDNTLDAVFITDDRGQYVDVNEAAARLIGVPAEHILGRTYNDFQTWEPSTDLMQLQEEVEKSGEASGELRFVSANGVVRDVEYFSKTNFIPGYHLSVVHDLTERRRGEQARMAKDAAERANRAKSEFLSRMSHELRTPLNAILGFGQLLQMESSEQQGGEQLESVDYIVKAGQHLLNLINEVLDIARIEEGKLTISIEPIFVRDVLQESLDLMQTLAAQRDIEIKADLAWMDDCYVMGDRQRLQQVLLNLLANAIKYNNERGLVTVSCSELDYETDRAQRQEGQAEQEGQEGQQDPHGPHGPRGTLRISITDTGPGLSPDKVAKLFTPFERLGAEQGEVEGTGLGLALSKHLVEAMGGTIGVESEQGVGSTFWVELYAVDEQTPGLESIITGPLADNQIEANMRTVLYIEDNLSNLRLIERILKKWPGTSLVTAMQGRMGLDIAFEQQPDIILLDLHLPDMEGNEVLRLLREDPRTATIPVIILSADANPRRIDTLLAAGAQAYFTKPLDVKRLLKVLEEVAAKVAR